MTSAPITRRRFITGAGAAAASGLTLQLGGCKLLGEHPVVAVVRIKDGKVGLAVEQAIDLLGGIRTVTRGKQRIMLKPNLVVPDPSATTKPEVIRTLARMMKGAGKDVSIGEGSAWGPMLSEGKEVLRTRKTEILDRVQGYVFDQLGYTELAKWLGVPLINLHTGEMAQVRLPNAFVFDQLTVHKSLAETELLCSVPMMKTHVLAQVTLGIKNLVGVFPGVTYAAPRRLMHDAAAKVEPSGTAAAIIDMLRANRMGLVVVDGSMAMEGQGPTAGKSFQMNVIVAGTNPLATDMAAASIMGFQPGEIPTFEWAHKAGLKPDTLAEIEVRGERLENVRRSFERPRIVPWSEAAKVFAVREV